METILITGLDGSGKSTILRELSKIKSENNFDIIYLPHIDLNSLENDQELKKTASFVNHLNQYADKIQSPGLKSIAIFSAMLLFKKIYGLKTKSGLNTIFCERHPLIDTIVYAQFYAEKAGFGFQNLNKLNEIDDKYKGELEYLAQQIPSSFTFERKADISWFASFIFKRFFIEKKLKADGLKELFEVGLPDKIYYLKASAEILYKRITYREIHEAHENVEVLTKLALEYDKLFTELNFNHADLVEVIDAESISKLNEFKDSMVKKYKNSFQ